MKKGIRQSQRSGIKALALTASLLLSGCAELVQYTDELSNEATGRTFVVTSPATLGGMVGFVIGIPADILALPVTYSVYAIQKSQDSLTADPLSTMLFPSFFLWRAGKLVAAPFDLVEYSVYRAWRSPETLTREEREEIEFRHDEESLPSYPVRPLLPIGTGGSAPPA